MYSRPLYCWFYVCSRDYRIEPDDDPDYHRSWRSGAPYYRLPHRSHLSAQVVWLCLCHVYPYWSHMLGTRSQLVNIYVAVHWLITPGDNNATDG